MKREDFLAHVNDYKFPMKGRFREELEGDDCSFESLVLNYTDGHYLADGYFYWPQKEDPGRLASFTDSKGDSWGRFVIADKSCNPKEPIKSIAEIHEHNKEWARTSRYYYPDSAIKKLGTEGTSSVLTEEEIQTLNSVMTPVERVIYEKKVARHVSMKGEGNPFLMASTENPLQLYISGDDDASWTVSGKIEKKDKFHSFIFDMLSFLNSPDWYTIEGGRWYFSN